MLVVIGMGANLGMREAVLEAAVVRMASHPHLRLLRRSRWRETEPVGGPAGQPRFLNGAVLVESRLEPLGLLETLLAIERELGRDRTTEARHGPRAIDLDVLFIEGVCVDSPSLSVPHPRLRERRFALEPLLEVLPDACDPRDGEPLARFLATLP